MRTNNIDDPASWRMWDGTGSGSIVASLNPYTNTLRPAHATRVRAGVRPCRHDLREPHLEHVFQEVAPDRRLAGPGLGPSLGFYYYTSDDLVNWSQPKLLMRGRLPWTYQRCIDPEQIRDPSLLDPNSESRNFDTTGQRGFLYFTRFHINASCDTSLDRDLIRIPIEFANRQPGGPTVESLTASDPTPAVGDAVQFTANNVADPDGGTITTYKWDLDGDGNYELDSGTSPRASRSYTANERLTVTVRACDNDGKGTDRTLVLGHRDGPASGAAPAIRRGLDRR